MPSTEEPSPRSEEKRIADRVQVFLMRNFPQIAMHGGNAAVETVDEESGEVWLQLGGACSGCGISPMTVQAIQARLSEAVEGVTAVHVAAGIDPATSFPNPDEGEQRYPDAPF